MVLFDRKIIGWSMSRTLEAKKTVIPAFMMAIHRRPWGRFAELIVHYDRGVKYACDEFRKLVKGLSIKQSMSRKANCWSITVAEKNVVLNVSLFKSLKIATVATFKIKSSIKKSTHSHKQKIYPSEIINDFRKIRLEICL
jgi:transposase InsO family protein